MHITGFHPGDNIEIELPDGTNHQLTVVGLVTDQITSKPDPNSTNNAYITLRTLGSFGLDSNFNQLFIRGVGDGSNSELIANVAVNIEESGAEPAKSLSDR